MANPAYERLKNCDSLPSPTGVVMEILRLAGDESATINAISAVVESDPALAGKMLKLVNSPFSGLPRKIASVSTAVRLLGIRTVKNMALTLSLVSNYRKGRCAAFDYEAFWSGSLLRAVAARGITNRLADYSPEEAFTTGLLSKVGQLALATVFPQEYASVVSEPKASDPLGLADAERQAFGIDHNELSAEMMADWYFPELFCSAVRRQDQPFRDGQGTNSRADLFTRILLLAGNVTSVLLQPQACPSRFSELRCEAERLGISREMLHQLLDVISSEWRAAATIFSVSISEVSALEEISGAAPPAEVRDQATPQPSAAPAEKRLSADAVRVLIVDDDPSTLRLLGRYLTDAGYNVLTAESSEKALEIQRSGNPQMVITDLVMPQMDGLELCRRLRPQEGAGFIYIIVLTARSEKSVLVEALDAGADDFLTKPFGREELLAHVRAGERIVRLEAKLAERSREVSRYNARLATTNNKLRALATIDELTGLPNRREAMARLAEHWSLAARHTTPFSCISADIDHFKSFNDTYGHAVGDFVLKATAAVLRRASRAGDVVCRFGGEEFLVICPNLTAGSAEAAAERLRQAVQQNPVKYGANELTVTLSLGVAERADHMRGPDDLLKSADDALYAAKWGGRNRVCVAGEHRSLPDGGNRLSSTGAILTPPGAVNPLGLPVKVLVIDEDPVALAVCRKALEGSGCVVSEASSESEVVDRILTCSPEVVLLDAPMQSLDWRECLRRLKATPQTQEIPVIVLSAAGEPETIGSSLAAGADDFVVKPFRAEEFVLRVRAMARFYRSKTELIWGNRVRWEQGRAMQLLLELSHGLAGATSIDEILEDIIKAAAELTWARRISIMLPDQDRTSLAIAKSTGMDQEVATTVRVLPGSGIAGRVFASGEPVMINTPGKTVVGESQYDSQFFVSAPLMSRALRTTRGIVGVLNITDRFGQRPFEPQVLESIDVLCGIAASAIDDFLTREARDRARDALVVTLATLTEHHDLDTGRHLERVTKYAGILAEELQKQNLYRSRINDTFLQFLHQAVPLHDIGKVAVPDHILLKPGKLTTAEFAVMKRHTQFGARTIRSIIERAPGDGFLRMAEEIAQGHHEWYDGSGYPQGLKGDAIPLAARIVTLADVYDALTSKRSYRAAVSPERASEIIRGASGSQFDPAIVEAFVRREAEFAGVAAQLADEPAEGTKAEARTRDDRYSVSGAPG
jgi:two-component system, cell cycle response regulator